MEEIGKTWPFTLLFSPLPQEAVNQIVKDGVQRAGEASSLAVQIVSNTVEKIKKGDVQAELSGSYLVALEKIKSIVSNFTKNEITTTQAFIIGGVIGVAVTSFVYFSTRRKPRTVDGDDSCLSFFYDSAPGPDGIGFPTRATCTMSTLNKLTKIHPEYRKLPAEIYGQAVERLPIVCVDIICYRKSDAKIVLFYRRDPPAANIWWWPGGRMYRGETFYSAAVRKLSEETGVDPHKISPKSVLQVWNTFFPDSSFDKGRANGREGTQTVNIVVLCEIEGEVVPETAADAHRQDEAKEQWAVVSEKWVTVEEALFPGAYDKYVSCNVQLARDRGLI